MMRSNQLSYAPGATSIIAEGRLFDKAEFDVLLVNHPSSFTPIKPLHSCLVEGSKEP